MTPRLRTWDQWVLPALVALALLAGGGSMSGMRVDGWLSALGAAAILLLVAAHATGMRPMALRTARAPLAMLFVLALLVLFQLWPLGFDAPWLGDDSRSAARWALETSGATPTGTLSLDPHATLRFGLRWLLPVAILLAALGARTGERQRALDAVLVVAVLHALLVVIQRAGAPDVFYPFGNTAPFAGGLFANPNHGGLLAAVAIVLAATRWQRRAWIVGLSLLMVTAAIASGSRAAVGLVLVALGLAVVEMAPARRRVAVALVGITALALAGAVAWSLLSPAGLDTEGRALFWPAIADMASSAMPWGVGFGAFATAFRSAEPLDIMGSTYINEAHNAPLQWWAEGGVAGLALLLAATVWLVRTGWRGRGEPRARACLYALALIILHSLVDYPLRTVAFGGLAMALVGLMLPQAPEREASGRGVMAMAAAGLIAVAAAWASTIPFRAQALADEGDYDAALALSPDLATARIDRAQARFDGGDLAGAREDAHAALANSPVRADAYRLDAMVREAQGQDVAWAHTTRLGWRDWPSQAYALVEAIEAGRSDAIARHAEALLRRRIEPKPIVGLVRVALGDPVVAQALATRMEGHRALAIALRVDRDVTDAELDGVETLLRAMDAPPLASAHPVLERRIERGQQDLAATLYRDLFGEAGLGTDLAAQRPPTLFQWRLRPSGKVRTKVAADSLVINARLGARDHAASRVLLPPSDTRGLAADVDMDGPGALTLSLDCAGRRVTAQASASGAISLPLDARQCPAPSLSLRVTAPERAFTVKIGNFRWLQDAPGD